MIQMFNSFIALMLFFTVAEAKPKKILSGYLVRNTSNQIYFVKNLNVIAPGILVELSKKSAHKKLCIIDLKFQRKKKLCFKQTFSYSTKKKGRIYVITDIVLSK